MKADTKFKLGSVELEYFRGYFRKDGCVDERAVELPLAWWFIDKFKGPDLIEVGCVMPYYCPTTHPVFDLFDKHPNAVHFDAERLSMHDLNVLSVSTVEHMGQADYASEMIDMFKSQRWMQKAVSQPQNYLITFPCGVRRDLEEWLEREARIYAHYIVMARISATNEWMRAEPQDMRLYDYAKPYPFGNAICIVTNQRELLG